MPSVTKRIGLLHIGPHVGELERNRGTIERGTEQAAAMGAEWIISGELVVCGYSFDTLIGTTWIEPQPDTWMKRYASMARDLNVTLFVSHPERAGELLFNSMFVIDNHGSVVGTHRKICITPESEAWSSPGDHVETVNVDGVSVGLLICADAYSTEPARLLKEQGAQVLISSAAWHPGEWGPSGEWEARSSESQLPLVVCNRTGIDQDASFLDAVTVLVDNGHRLASLQSAESTVFIVDLIIGSDQTCLELVDQCAIDDPSN